MKWLLDCSGGLAEMFGDFAQFGELPTLRRRAAAAAAAAAKPR